MSGFLALSPPVLAHHHPLVSSPNSYRNDASPVVVIPSPPMESPSTRTTPATANVSITMVRRDEDGNSLASAGSDDDADDDSNNLRLVLPRMTPGSGGRPQRIRVCLEWSASADGFVKCQTIATTEGDDDFDDGGVDWIGFGSGRNSRKKGELDENIEIDENGPISDGNSAKRRDMVETDVSKKLNHLFVSDAAGKAKKRSGADEESSAAAKGARDGLKCAPLLGEEEEQQQIKGWDGNAAADEPKQTAQAASLSSPSPSPPISLEPLFPSLEEVASSGEQTEVTHVDETDDGDNATTNDAEPVPEAIPDRLLMTPRPTLQLRPAPAAAKQGETTSAPRQLSAPRLRQRADASATATLVAEATGAPHPLYLTPNHPSAARLAPLLGASVPLMPSFDTASAASGPALAPSGGKAAREPNPKDDGGKQGEGNVLSTPQTASARSTPEPTRRGGQDGSRFGGGGHGAQRVAAAEMPAEPDLESEPEAEPEPEPDLRKAEGVKPSPIVHRIGGAKKRSGSRERELQMQQPPPPPLPQLPTQQADTPRVGSPESEKTVVIHAQHGNGSEARPWNASPSPVNKPCPSNKSEHSGRSGGNAQGGDEGSMGLSTLADLYADRQRAYYVNSGCNRIDPATVPNPSCALMEAQGLGSGHPATGTSPRGEGATAEWPQASNKKLPSATPRARQNAQNPPHPEQAPEREPVPFHPMHRPHYPPERNPLDPYSRQYEEHQQQHHPPPPSSASPHNHQYPFPGAWPPMYHHHDPYGMYHHHQQPYAPAGGGGMYPHHPHPYASYHQFPYPAHAMYNYHAYAYGYGMYPPLYQTPDMRGRIIDVDDGAESETSSITMPMTLPRGSVGGGGGGAPWGEPYRPHLHGAGAVPLRHRHQPQNPQYAIDEEDRGVGAEESKDDDDEDDDGVAAVPAMPPPLAGSPNGSASSMPLISHAKSSASTERTKNVGAVAVPETMRRGDRATSSHSAPAAGNGGGKRAAKELDVMGQIVEMLTPACCAANTSRTYRNLGALQPWHSVMSINQHVGLYRVGNGHRRAGSAHSGRSENGSMSSGSERRRDGHHHYVGAVGASAGSAVSSMSQLRGSFL